MELLRDEELWEIPSINTHCHHLRSETFTEVTLHQLMQMTYISWILPDQGDNSDEHARVFSLMGANTYFTWWKAAIEKLYGDGRQLTPESWSWFDERVRQAYKQPDHDIRLLLDTCRYQSILLDDYNKPGDAHGHLGLMRPVFRCDMFLCGHVRGRTDENKNDAYACFSSHPRNLTEYVQATRAAVLQAKERGAVGLKIAIAYERSLNFRLRTLQQAEEAFGNPEASPEQRTAFEDFMMYALCDIATSFSLPIQIHTGLGILQDSRAIFLRDLISSHPETRFVLFHGSYPWCGDVLGLAHNYRNVHIDICWLPLISTFRATSFLREALELVDAGRITWGCDTWTSEESFGARMAVHKVLRDTLNGFVLDGIFDKKQALQYACRILHDNAASLYGLDGKVV